MATEDLEPLDSTVSLIYDHVRAGPARQLAGAASLDAKATGAFAAASVVLGFGTFATADLGWLAGVLYIAAGVAYLVAGWETWQVVRVREFQVVDAADRWWPSHRLADAPYVREQLLDDLAEAAAHNRRLLDAKGAPFERLLIAVAAETVFVAAAVIASLA